MPPTPVVEGTVVQGDGFSGAVAQGHAHVLNVAAPPRLVKYFSPQSDRRVHGTDTGHARATAMKLSSVWRKDAPCHEPK
jgi:hypothetical protein